MGKRVAIIGAGMSPFGVRQANYKDLISEAGKACFDSLGGRIKPKDIDGFVLSSVMPERTSFQSHVASLAEETLGIRPWTLSARVEHMCASGNVGIRTAYASIVSGLSEMVMVLGVEKLNTPIPAESFANMMAGVDREWESCYGVTAPPIFALAARRHMEKYGTTEEQLACVSVKNHNHSKNNPYAHFQKGATLEQVLNARPIALPLKLFDCSPMTDGAAAVILTTEERAKDYTDKHVYILGTGQSINNFTVANMYEDLSHWPPLKKAGESAYRMAGIIPQDVDFAEVHDCFTIAEIIATEELGFCKKGEGGPFVQSGQSNYGGKIVINPRGGLIGCGHPLGATGVAQAVECFLQLRGEAGVRQVPDAKIGLAHNNSGMGEHTVVIYGRI